MGFAISPVTNNTEHFTVCHLCDNEVSLFISVYGCLSVGNKLLLLIHHLINRNHRKSIIPGEPCLTEEPVLCVFMVWYASFNNHLTCVIPTSCSPKISTMVLFCMHCDIHGSLLHVRHQRTQRLCKGFSTKLLLYFLLSPWSMFKFDSQINNFQVQV